jgi:hypothetical protein
MGKIWGVFLKKKNFKRNLGKTPQKTPFKKKGPGQKKKKKKRFFSSTKIFLLF